MIENKFPLYDNMRKVNTHDADAYDKMIERQMNDLDSVPEGWQ
jgi:hypothetical protein